MGAEGHIHPGIIARAALLALLLATPAIATDDAVPAAGEASVATRAMAVAATPEPPTPRGDALAVGIEGGVPLTRAANRLRIDRMSPERWLAGFGEVEVEVERGR